MSYITYTTEVKNNIAEIKTYPLVNFDINVDGTACLLVRYSDGKYYQEKVSRDDMKKQSKDLAKHIVNKVESYFNGWGAKNGLRN
jgi:hypothetical protein